NCPPTTFISTLSLHDALPIFDAHVASSSLMPSKPAKPGTTGFPQRRPHRPRVGSGYSVTTTKRIVPAAPEFTAAKTSSSRRGRRSEEHTSELQSRFDLVCRLL